VRAEAADAQIRWATYDRSSENDWVRLEQEEKIMQTNENERSAGRPATGRKVETARTVVLRVAIGVMLVLAASAASAGPGRNALIKKVLETYKESDRSIWDLENVRGGGTVMVITQDGALGSLSTDSRYYGTDVKDGRLSNDGTPMGRNSVLLKAGQRVYLTSVKIIDYQGSDILRMFFLTADTTQRAEAGNTATRRYKGTLDYYFPGGYLETAEFAEVKTTINKALVAVSEYQEAPPATVSLGMTPEQVEGVLGKPSKIVDLGSKKIFVYADIKVTFVDGKVADVE